MYDWTVGGDVVIRLSLPIGAVHGGLGGQPLASLPDTLTEETGPIMIRKFH